VIDLGRAVQFTEATEKFLAVIGRNTHASVANMDSQFVHGRKEAGFDDDLAFFGELKRIFDQVDQHLFEAALIAIQTRRQRAELFLDWDIRGREERQNVFKFVDRLWIFSPRVLARGGKPGDCLQQHADVLLLGFVFEDLADRVKGLKRIEKGFREREHALFGHLQI